MSDGIIYAVLGLGLIFGGIIGYFFGLSDNILGRKKSRKLRNLESKLDRQAAVQHQTRRINTPSISVHVDYLNTISKSNRLRFKDNKTIYMSPFGEVYIEFMKE